MLKKRRLTLAVRTALGLGTALGVLPILAQAQETSTMEEIVVTGSRIKVLNATSTSPIANVSGQEVKLKGVTDISSLINDLPQNYQNSVSDFSNTSNPLNGPGGVSTANLRGLGPQRTLVLVDGRRLGIGDPNTGNTNPAPDLNQIPAQLVERIEVVTGGASAVYGSDAIAGVLNFIMKKDFEGVQFDVQAGEFMHENDNGYMQDVLEDWNEPAPDGTVHDGRTRSFNVIVGGNFADDKGNATAYLNYQDRDPIVQSERDFSACRFTTNAAGVGRCSGSANSNLFSTSDADLTVVGHEFLEWPQSGSNPPSAFNSNRYAYLQREDERYSAGAFTHYDFSEQVQLYSEFTFMNDRSETYVAPSGLFLGGNPFAESGGYQVNCNNPLLSAQQQGAMGCTPAMIGAGDSVDMLIGRRNVEGGGRGHWYEHENYRGVFGFKGDLNPSWSYDAYGSYYYTTLNTRETTYISNVRAQRALQVENVAGVPTCRTAIDGTDKACVPWNIFQDGGVTPDALAYLDSFGIANGSTSETVISASLTGELGEYGLQLPWASEGVGVALGVERRTDEMDFNPDETTGSGDLSGGSGLATSVDASIEVDEVFVEARVPLVQQKAWIDELVFETGYRYSDYDLAGSVDTYKYGFQYAPTPDVRLRMSYQRAIRAPNIIELFNQPSLTQTSDYEDTCAGAAPGSSLADCMRTGVTPAQYGNIVPCPSDQCGVLNGGNEALEPEEADTRSIGLTFSPQSLPAFIATIDWYEIEIEGVIDSVPLSVTFNNCLETGSPTWCNGVVRTSAGNLFGSNAANGGYVDGRSVNIASLTVSGVDIQAAYRYELQSYGAITAALSGGWVDENKTTPLPGEHEYDCSGLFGATCETVNPEWRHVMRLGWDTPWNVLVSLQWRHIGEVELDTNTSDETLSNGRHDSFNAKMDAQDYFDLSAIWEATDNISVRAGINNLFDEEPPLISNNITGTGSPNSYPTYDQLGTELFMGVTASF